MFLTGFITILEATQSISTETADMLKKEHIKELIQNIMSGMSLKIIQTNMLAGGELKPCLA